MRFLLFLVYLTLHICQIVNERSPVQFVIKLNCNKQHTNVCKTYYRVEDEIPYYCLLKCQPIYVFYTPTEGFSDVDDDMFYTVIVRAAGSYILKAVSNVKGNLLKTRGKTGTKLTKKVSHFARWYPSVFGLGMFSKNPTEELLVEAIEQTREYSLLELNSTFTEDNTLNYLVAKKKIGDLGKTGRQYEATFKTIFVNTYKVNKEAKSKSNVDNENS